MFTKSISYKLAFCSLAALPLLTSCNDDEGKSNTTTPEFTMQNYSVNPALVKTLAGFDGVKVNTVISSDDKLSLSPDFVFGPQPDGAAMFKNPNGDGFVMINNHEISFSVSRVYLDKNLKPTKGEYIVDAAGGRMRLCSATLATPQEHGFGPVFLTAGESGAESMIHAIDPMGDVLYKKTDRTLPALGKCSAENAVPLPKEAFAGKTVILIGEDDSNGQVNMYVSGTGDLHNGKLYMMRRTNNGSSVETDMQVGTAYDVEFVEYDNVKTSTGAQLATQTVTKNALMLARVEDLDYGKGSVAANRTIYFTATGVSAADKETPVAGKTMWGRIYKLALNATDPLKGTLTPLIDGGSTPGLTPGNSIINPDNICVTQNYVYIQEDGDSFYKANGHDGRIWQMNLTGGNLKPMLEMDHRRNDATFNSKYNPSNSQNKSSWEYGAMLDISDLVGKPGTFMVNIHPHTWTDDKFLNADGSGLITNKEGGQTVILTGVER